MDGFMPSLLCIEDPLDKAKDISRSSYGAMYVKQAFDYAYIVLVQAVLNPEPRRFRGGTTTLARIIRIPEHVIAYRKWVMKTWALTSTRSNRSNVVVHSHQPVPAVCIPPAGSSSDGSSSPASLSPQPIYAVFSVPPVLKSSHVADSVDQNASIKQSDQSKSKSKSKPASYAAAAAAASGGTLSKNLSVQTNAPPANSSTFAKIEDKKIGNSAFASQSVTSGSLADSSDAENLSTLSDQSSPAKSDSCYSDPELQMRNEVPVTQPAPNVVRIVVSNREENRKKARGRKNGKMSHKQDTSTEKTAKNSIQSSSAVGTVAALLLENPRSRSNSSSSNASNSGKPSRKKTKKHHNSGLATRR
jgi:hypothetical protein